MLLLTQYVQISNADGTPVPILQDITSSNWQALTDGNEADRRSWPAANSVNVHMLPSLCASLGDIPGVTLWGEHIWRLRK